MSDSTNPAEPQFKRKKILTLATFKLEVDKARYFLLLDAMHVGRKRGKPRLRPDGTEEEPPTLTHVVDMVTGEHGQMMVAEIIKTELSETYPDHGYVGRAFAITKQRRKEGKRYDPYNLEELEVPDALKPVAEEAIQQLKMTKVTPAPAEPSVPPAEVSAPVQTGARRR